jgi:hypothetical protein
MANAGTFKKGEKRPNQGKRGAGKLTATVKSVFEDTFKQLQWLQRWASKSRIKLLRGPSHRHTPRKIRRPHGNVGRARGARIA